jgi:ABC-2 type transport system permease protein
VTPPSVRSLLADLFEVNTFWELSTKSVHAEPTAGGTWRVTLNIAARKVAVDSDGKETERPINEPIEIGVFAEDGKLLYLQKHLVRSGQQRITVIVPGKPARTGIYPRNILIDTEPRDNIVEIKGSTGVGRP